MPLTKTDQQNIHGVIYTGVGLSFAWAYANPDLVGLKGLAGAAIVGFGTSVATRFSAGAGVVVFATAARPILKKIFPEAEKEKIQEFLRVAAIGGALAFGLPGFFKGHGYTADIVLNGVRANQTTAAPSIP